MTPGGGGAEGGTTQNPPSQIGVGAKEASDDLPQFETVDLDAQETFELEAAQPKRRPVSGPWLVAAVHSAHAG